MISKQDVINACALAIKKRIDSIEESIVSAKETAAKETKSSAGDKFETTRAMMHLELERLSKQLAEAQHLQQLNVLAAQKSYTETIALGSLVTTTNGTYFIGAGLGKIMVKGTIIFSISTESPIGKLLIGIKAGECITFNGSEICILGLQ